MQKRLNVVNINEISFKNLDGIDDESLKLNQEISKDDFKLIESEVTKYENKIKVEERVKQNAEKDARKRLRSKDTTNIVTEIERKRVQKKIDEVAKFKKDNPTKITTTFENLIDNNSLNLDSKINRDNFEKIKALVNNNVATVASIKRLENARNKKEKEKENDNKPVVIPKRPSSAPSSRSQQKTELSSRPGSAPRGGQDFNLVKSKFPRARSLSPIRRR